MQLEPLRRRRHLRTFVRALLVLAVGTMMLGAASRWQGYWLNPHTVDPWDGPDKAWHVVASFGMTAIVALAMREIFGARSQARWVVPLLFTASVGVAKELFDFLTFSDVSARDVISDLVGGVIGLVVVALASVIVSDGLPTPPTRTQGRRP